MVNHLHPQTARTFEVQRTIIDKYALLRRALGDLESNAKDGFFGLARTHVARTEENNEIAAQLERFDAVLIELQRLVVDGTDEVLAGARGVSQDRTHIRILFRLREHEGGEFLARKRARAIKKRAVEIFVQRNLAGVEGGKGEVVPVLKFFVVEIESGGGLTA